MGELGYFPNVHECSWSITKSLRKRVRAPLTPWLSSGHHAVIGPTGVSEKLGCRNGRVRLYPMVWPFTAFVAFAIWCRQLCTNYCIYFLRQKNHYTTTISLNPCDLVCFGVILSLMWRSNNSAMVISADYEQTEERVLENRCGELHIGFDIWCKTPYYTLLQSGG